MKEIEIQKKKKIFIFIIMKKEIFFQNLKDEYGKCLKMLKFINQNFPKKEYDNIRENRLYQNYNNDIIY